MCLQICIIRYLYGEKSGFDFCLEYIAFGSKFREDYITVRRIRHDYTPAPFSRTPPHRHADATKRVAESHINEPVACLPLLRPCSLPAPDVEKSNLTSLPKNTRSYRVESIILTLKVSFLEVVNFSAYLHVY